MKPPPLAATLLRLLIRDPEAREVVLGDLEEELRTAVAPARSARAARRWYWRQALASIVACRRLARRPRGMAWRELTGAGWGQDLRHAARLARQAPGFTAVAALMLAIGLAGVITVTSLVAAVLLAPLPYADPGRLVAVGDGPPGGDLGNTGYATWLDWKAQSHSFTDLAMLRSWTTTHVGDRAEWLQGSRVTSNLLPMLGVEPALGRGFLPEEDQPDHRYVVLLTDGLWRRSFGADPAILGRTIDLGGTAFRVVGVLPPSFDSLAFDQLYGKPELFAPIGYEPGQPWACRSCQHLRVLAKLAPGVSPAVAEADLEAIQRRLRAAFPQDYASDDLTVAPLDSVLVRTARPALWVLFGAVACVLLIACVNVASLLLARSSQRRREVEIRAALGAPRARLLRQLLAESALLALVGGGLGLGLARAALALVVRYSPARLPRLESAAIDLRVLAVTAAVVVLTTLAFGLAPALALARAGTSGLGGGRRTTAGRRVAGGRRLLVVVNVALAFVLLVGAGLMLESVARLLRVNPGFEPRGVLTLQLSFLADRFTDDAPTYAAMEEILARVGALPGVEHVAMAAQVPLGGNYDSQGVEVEGQPAARAEDVISLQRYPVTPDYFATLGVPLRRGRLFSTTDRADGELVMLLGETAAATLFPGEEALGKRIRFGGGDKPWRTVVGIVGDVRHVALSSAVSAQMYLPESQYTDRLVVLAVRASGAQAAAVTALAPAIRREVAAVAPEVPVYGVAALADLATATAARERFTSALLGTFSLVALLLAAVGLYGLIAYLVESRRREVGIRLALGALRQDIARFVLRPGLGLLLAGLAAGWAAAYVSTRFLASLLFGVRPDDLATYAGISLLLLVTGLLAHLVPLRRALGVDPTTTLRAD